MQRGPFRPWRVVWRVVALPACRAMVLLALAVRAAPAAPVELDGSRDAIDLDPRVEVLVDPTGRLGVAEVRSPAFASRFEPVADGQALNLGLTRAALWLRFTLERSSSEAPAEWVIGDGIAPTAEVELHGAGPVPMRSGALTPVSERPMRARAAAFPIRLEVGTPRTFHMRVVADTSLLVDLSLLTREAFFQRQARELAAITAVGGLYLALVLTNLALFASLRERTHLELAAVLAFVALFLCVQFGLGSLFLWPGWSGFERVASPLFASLALLAGAFFARDFLEAHRRAPVLSRVLRALSWAAAGCVGLALVDPFVANVVATVVSCALYLTALTGCALVLRRGYAPARLFLVAISLGLIGGLMTLAMVVGLAGYGFWTAGLAPLALAVAGILMTVALGRRIAFLESSRAQVFQAVDEAIFVLDRATGEVLERNPAAERLVAAGIVDDALAHGAGALASREERRVAGADGERWIEISRVDTDLVGKPRQLVVVRDVSERHLAEQARRQLRERADQMQRMEAIGTLAGGLAHDFNNLLTTVLGSVSLLRSVGLDAAEADRYLEMAEKACDRATHLTNRLLTFARGGAPVREPTRVRGIVEDAVSFATAGSTVRAHLDVQSHPVAELDAGQITLALQNIVVNAVQAMPMGGHVHVTLRARRLGENEMPLPAGEYAEVEIRDEGVGISEEHLPRIFDPYFTTKQAGSGLGLTTTYSVVRRHGGFIDVRSEGGRGTTFRVLLPASRHAPVSDAILPALTIPRASRVLVMDDEDGVRATALHMLESFGQEAEGVHDGHEAVERYGRALSGGRPFDLVVLDLTIPGSMGGLETLERLQEMDPGVRAVVSSGYSNDPIMASHRQHGFAAMLPKPYSREALRAVLLSVVGADTGSAVVSLGASDTDHAGPPTDR